MYQKRLDSLRSDDDEVEILYADTDRDDITFYGKKDEAVHRWYLLTAAYAPAHVRRILSEFEDDRGVRRVLDPFAGTGTTLLEAKKQGHDAVGVEYNPVYHEVATAKTTWSLDPDRLAAATDDLFDRARHYRAEWDGVAVDDFEAEFGIHVPHIYDRQRWWHDAVLRDLLAARDAIADLDVDADGRRFLRTGILGILVEVSNATYNHVSLTYMDDPPDPDDVDVFDTLDAKLQGMLADLRVVHGIDDPGTVEVRRGDSTALAEHVAADEVDTVVTSPPYPNRYSYLRETRPHLFFFDMVEDAGEVGDMALDSIGGTWGRATSQLEDAEIEPENDVVGELVGDLAAEIGGADARMENYVLKYFNKMERHLRDVDRVVDDGGKLAYTVGNSKLKDVVVPTDEILAELFRVHGFPEVRITRERQRNSKTELYEAVVYGYRE